MTQDKLWEIDNKKPPNGGSCMRWEGLEPSRLAAHGPQPCLSANSSTSAEIVVL
jgi:hypothetical protein